MNIAIILTSVRLILTPFVVLSILFWNLYITLSILFIALLSDLLDGYVARRTNSVTEEGAIVDSVADKIMIGSTVIALFLKYDISLLDLFFILIRDIVVGAGAIFIFLFGDWKKFDVHSKYSGKLVTFFQGAVILLVLLRFKYVPIFIWFVFILGLICIVDYFFLQREALKAAFKSNKK